MIEVTKKEIDEKDLRLVGRVGNSDFSKMILLMERFKENKKIKYYMMDFIFYNEKTQAGEFIVSFWQEPN